MTASDQSLQLDHARALRQPKPSPTSAPSGTPAMIAKVSPLVTMDRARPRRSGPSSATAYPLAAGMKLAADKASSSRTANSSIARCQRGEQVGKGENAHGGRQQAAPLQLGRQHGDDRSADGIGEGEGGDQMAGRGQADVQVSR